MTKGSRASAHGDNSETFEQNFQRLQEVVQKLSEGNLTLQEALGAFEEGMALTEACSTMLDQAELRVKQVSERALRAGQAALAELEGSMRNPATSFAEVSSAEEPELVTFEVETFETTLIFDAPQENSPARPGEFSATNPKSKTQSQRYTDPLFDEDD
jgi:exodeoxyribonuclease VII small subunit